MAENTMDSGTAEILREAGDKVTSKLGNLRRSVEDRRKATAAGLASAAERLHHTADNLPGVERASELAHGAADRIGGAADFLRDHDTKDMVTGVERLVRKHPGKSLAVAAVVGFLVARAFRKD